MALERCTSLRLRNHLHVDARLRFHCGRHLLWDTRMQSGSTLDVPDPACADIEIDACHLDPHTQVASTVCVRLARGVARSDVGLPRLVAKMLGGVGNSGFVVEQEASPHADGIALLNLTAVEVRVRYRLLGTPFACVLHVPAQAEHGIAPCPIQVSATAEGVTTPALSLSPWRGSTVAIDASQDFGEPQLRWTPARS
ncbi:MAG: hypothetical protein ABW002_07665 [Xanthomonas sp.]